MIVKYVPEATGGHWRAEGNGPLRYVLAEGTSRREALRGYVDIWREQNKRVSYGVVRGNIVKGEINSNFFHQ